MKRNFLLQAIIGALGITQGTQTPFQRAMRGQMGAVVAVKSTAIGNRDSTPPVINSANIEKGELRESQGFAVLANGDSIGSTYPIGQLRSSDRMSEIKIYCADIGSTGLMDLGLYRTTQDGGAVVDADFFGSAIAVSGGALNGVDITFEAAAAGGLLTNGEKRVWEALGLSADPLITYDVVATLTAASDAAGTVLIRYRFVSGN